MRTSQNRHRRGSSEALTYQQAQVRLDAPERTHPLHRHRQENKALHHTPQGCAKVREEYRLDRVFADVLLGQGEPKKAQFDRRTM